MRRLTVLGHPVHPALTDLPLGLLPAALLFDLIGLLGRFGGASPWLAGYWCTSAGLLFSAPTAVSGLLDLVAIPREEQRAADLAIWHLCAALCGVGFFVATLVMRPQAAVPAAPLRSWLVALEGAGTLSLLAAGWLGGHLVFHHGVAVERLDAPR